MERRSNKSTQIVTTVARTGLYTEISLPIENAMSKCPVVFLSARKQARNQPSLQPTLPSLAAAMTDGVMSFPRERRQAKIYDFGKAAADFQLRRHADTLDLGMSELPGSDPGPHSRS
jgi:hypothetical protein